MFGSTNGVYVHAMHTWEFLQFFATPGSVTTINLAQEDKIFMKIGNCAKLLHVFFVSLMSADVLLVCVACKRCKYTTTHAHIHTTGNRAMLLDHSARRGVAKKISVLAVPPTFDIQAVEKGTV